MIKDNQYFHQRHIFIKIAKPILILLRMADSNQTHMNKIRFMVLMFDDHIRMSMPKTCSSPRRDVCSHSLVCSENSLLIVGIRPILNKELEIIFRSDRSDRTYVYSQVSGLHDKLYIYKLKEKCIVFYILKCNAQCQALCNVTQSVLLFQ